MSFRVGGRSVEGTGPSTLCSFGHRQHGELHLLPQVDLLGSIIPSCISVLCVWFLFHELIMFVCLVAPLRWLLLGFQREFEHSDALRLFEILSCDHLELISQQVDQARYQERLARKFSAGESQNSSWQNK